MIEEAYCSYEVSKLLKEKGFDVPVKRMISSNNLVWSIDEARDLNAELSAYCSQPTYQMAMRWLREAHNLIIEVRVKHHFRIFDGYYAGIVHLDGDVHYEYTPDVYSTYEEAVEAAVRYCLENLL